MNTIGKKTQERIVADIEGHMETYLEDINQAYMEAENVLTVTFTVKLSTPKDGQNGVAIETKIAFVKEKITDACESIVDEQQHELPFGDDGKEGVA